MVAVPHSITQAGFFSFCGGTAMIKSRAGRSLEVCSVSDTAWDNGNALPPSKVSLHRFDTDFLQKTDLLGKKGF